MIHRKNILQIAAIAMLLAAVVVFHRPRGAEASQPPSHPVITRLVGRNLTITVTAGPRGPLYSAVDRTGKPLASNLTLDELRDRHPELSRHIEPAVCDTAAPAWAGIDRD